MSRRDDWVHPDWHGEVEVPPWERDSAGVSSPSTNGHGSSQREEPKPSERIELVDLARRERIEVKHVVDGLMPQGSLVAVGGQAKRAKSTLIRHLVRHVSCGDRFLDRPTDPCPCLYLNGEMSPDYMQTLAEQIVGNGDPEMIRQAQQGLAPCHVIERTPRPFTMPRLRVETSLYDTPGVVVLDSFRAFWQPSGDEENKSGFVGPILRAIADWCHETGWTCIVIQHFGKYASGDDESSFAGSGEWAACCDVLWLWKRGLNEDIGRLRISGRIPPVDDIAVEVSPSRCRSVGSPAQARRDQRMRQILSQVPESEPGWTFEEIKERVFEEEKIALKTVKDIVGEMVDSGKLFRTGNGTSNSPYQHWQESVPSPVFDRGDGRD